MSRSTATAVGDTAKPSATDASGRPITVTGCLQETGTVGTLVLTEINEPSHSVGEPGKSVGTTGKSQNGDVVRSEQRREAAASYRIDPPRGTDTKDMIGKQVRVTGTLTDAGSVDRDTSTIRPGDLAGIKANAMAVENQSCGGSH
jgi:hypothetical protein